MILQANDIYFSYGANDIFKGASFEVNDREKIGIIGSNGCGKSTLIKLIAGELTPVSGDFKFKNGITIGYMDEEISSESDGTVMDEMKTAGGAEKLLSRMKYLESKMSDDPSLMEEYAEVSSKYEAVDGYNLITNAVKILKGMSFRDSDFDKKVSLLSGGEKTRLALSKMLISNPDFLLLDEPTNHLDVAAMEWLDRFIKDYRGAVIAISHDRWFLANVPSRIIEVVNGKCRTFTGGYQEYVKKRDFFLTEKQKEYERNVAEKRRLIEYAEKNIVRASTSKMAKSRIKMAERIDDTPPDAENHVKLTFSITPRNESYKDVLTLKDLSIGFGNRVLFKGFSTIIQRGEKIVILGSNGTGKTTLLNVMTGTQQPLEGTCAVGDGVVMSVFEQNVYRAIDGSNPLQYFWNIWPRMSEFEIRSHLARYGFTGESVFTDISGMSGGELARLQLAKIALEYPNLLLLDEPTNYLDLESKDELDACLNAYSGTVVTVTHDRYLASKLGGRVFYIDNGEISVYESYDKFLARDVARPEKRVQQAPSDQKTGKELRRQKAQYRQKLSDMEKAIDQLEKRIAFLNDESVKEENYKDHSKIEKIFSELDEDNRKLSELTDEYLMLLEEDVQ